MEITGKLIDAKDIITGDEVLVLFSGGFDSSACAYYLASLGLKPSLLSINYMNRPQQEMRRGREIAASLGLKLNEINVEVADFRDSEEDLAKLNFYNKAWLPYRNIIFFAAAANFAVRYGISYVSAGIRYWDTPYFNDSTNEYFDHLDSMLQFLGYEDAADARVRIVLPFIAQHRELTKMLQNDLDAQELLSRTWSCWFDGEEQCGMCSPCKARQRFLIALETGDGLHEFLQ
jgi:7-cyano-7-deazaguanine synthase